MKKIAVFASGNGSNFQAIAENFPVDFLFCDRQNAYVMERAKQLRVQVYHFLLKDFATKEAYEQELVKLLDDHKIDYVLLAGYMKVVGETLLSRYEGRIINIHPSYLPNFPGINAIARAFEANVASSGVTIHYVDAGIDTGKIIQQVEVPRYHHDTLEIFEKRIHEAEHRLFVEVLQKLLDSKGE